ncbi:Alpha/Beta hydrolase protein [Pyronema domesticum]|uniref:Similar to Putative alpha/beta hydrolase R526 acc. no. Q5UQ83 n=1 Tax=Pyronema omphalodes (strain CBS 100304) TaxID=1076935 RepID=U4L6S0_PYROM|nr:Alpha/Beta hydrolase protein [Pyronema domesticum]CCX05725.1 Similar to Putative alpha/beta hydrolase R526; acc. no. Q5UQ83 [Pyronema omphalodes CBS 100304]
MPRPRWALSLEANFWRNAMAAGMYLHKCASPVPPEPKFTISIPSTLSKFLGKIPLSFYVPDGYTRTSDTKYPVLVNYHGGGFTLGTASDDARWCATVNTLLNAVVISVDYRLAPEYPFPTAVEDGTDVLLWLHTHATEYAIDPARIGLSGFSAGGNMCFSVPLRLFSLQQPTPRLAAIAAFYPSTDFTSPREARRATNIRPDKELPKVFTDLFDASYLWPPKEVRMENPFLSPAMAGDADIHKALPKNVLIVLCEWDELRAEGERWRDRLTKLGLNVWSELVLGVAHGWDKAPNPVWEDRKAKEVYERVCKQLGKVFYGPDWKLPLDVKVKSELKDIPVVTASTQEKARVKPVPV